MDVLDWLYGLPPSTRLGLERVERLLGRLGDPHLRFRSVHVAGSNGKGSTVAMIESVLRASGLRTGRYTSPHLRRFNERITVAGEEIGEADLARLARRVKEAYEGETFFEATTAIAFLFFAEQEVDISIVEVGLGGRLDATNVLLPLLSVVSTISVEHSSYLGETIEEIAAEKAGIIKEGVPVVTSAQGEALKVIEATATKRGARLFLAEPAKATARGIAWGPYQDVALALGGDFQLINAGLALEAITRLPFEVGEAAIREGFADVVWPGRFERRGDLILDGAHNPAGVEALVDELRRLKQGRVIAVVGIMDDKDARGMIGVLDEVVDYYLFAAPRQARAADPHKLSSFTKRHKAVLPSVGKAIDRAKRLAGPDDLIVVTGSLYTIAEA